MVEDPTFGKHGGSRLYFAPPPHFLETNLKVYCRFNVINNTKLLNIILSDLKN